MSRADRSSLLFAGDESAEAVLPVRYERGVREVVQWEGAGSGVAVLTNEHGQVVYRVEEGGKFFEVLVPAGEYTLTIERGSGVGAAPLMMEVDPIGLARTRSFAWLQPEAPMIARGGHDGYHNHEGPHVDPTPTPKAPPRAPRVSGHITAERSYRGEDFSGVEVRAYFEGVDLRDAKFAGASDTFVRFKNCDLRGADFTGVRLEDTEFEQCDLRGARMVDTTIHRVNFPGCNMEGVDLSRANILGGNFTGLNMRGLKLVGATAAVPIFRSADLTGADMSDARLVAVFFEGANLTNARFDGARFEHGAYLSNANLTGATGL